MSAETWLFKPLQTAFGKVLWKTLCYSRIVYEQNCFSILFFKLPNQNLFFCGFSFILVPIIAAYWLLILIILLSEILIFCLLFFTFGLIFALIGMWAGPITALGLTGISLIRLPQNFFYHAVVTYRTVILRKDLKLISFLLLPSHLLVPILTFVASIIFYTVTFFGMSFIGFPLRLRTEIPETLKFGWIKFASDMDSFFTNYGDPSGIPTGWDGNVYGLPLDPVVLIISLFVYLIVFVPFSLATFLLFIIKAVPIFLGTITQFLKALSICDALSWFRKVLTDYSKIKVLSSYGAKLKGYASLVKTINPSKLSRLLCSYCTDMSPLKLIPSNMGVSILCLWIPILTSSILWLIGLVIVLTVPPLSFLILLLLWLEGWLVVIPFWPLLYVMGWVLIIFGPPCLYLLAWIAILVCPWILAFFGSLSGPFDAIKVISKLKQINL